MRDTSSSVRSMVSRERHKRLMDGAKTTLGKSFEVMDTIF